MTSSKPLVLHVDALHPDRQLLLSHVIPLVHSGQPIAMPTETVYGLAANAYDPAAVARIFSLKHRPADNPLIVHVSSLEMLRDLVVADEFPVEGSLARRLIDRFWPGPLTILFRRSSRVPDVVTAGHELVAIRQPSHAVAAAIISLSGLPLAAPSANKSGRPSPTLAQHVIDDFGSELSCVVDGGACTSGVESTVLDLGSETVLRPGGVTLEQLREVLPNVKVYQSGDGKLEDKPPTPGMKYRHYCPRAPVFLVEYDPSVEVMQKKIDEWITTLDEQKIIGIVHTRPELDYSRHSRRDLRRLDVGDYRNPHQVARGLFQALRELEQQVDVMLVEGISEEHEGLAVMNRLRKAASESLR